MDSSVWLTNQYKSQELEAEVTVWQNNKAVVFLAAKRRNRRKSFLG